MQTFTVKEAQSQFSWLISQIGNGEDVVITQDDKPVARLIPVEAPEVKTEKPRPQFGSARGMFTLAPDFDEPITNGMKPHHPRPQFGSAIGLGYMTPDFDEPLEKFKEYMERTCDVYGVTRLW